MTEASRAPLRLTVAAALATAAATLGLERLVQNGPWLLVCFLVIAVVGVVGHLMRTTRLPRPVVILVQLVAALCAVTLLRVPSSAIALFVPGPGAFHELGRQIADGRANITNEAPPAVATPGIATILALVCGAFAILIDAIAVTYRRAVLAGLPLLAVYLIPATRRAGGLSWLAFCVTAIGYLSLVSAEGHDRLNRWGRALGGPTRGPGELSGPANNPHSALSRRITVTAVAAALALPWFIPTLPGVFKTGTGNGTGTGGTISIDQSVDLRRSLTSSTAVPLLRYTTNSPDIRSDYLQMSVLDKFDGDSWVAGSSPQNPLDSSASVTIPGLNADGVKQSKVSTKISVTAALSFKAVPVPYAVSSVTGITQPAYDPSTLEVVPGDSTTRSRNGQQYTVVSTEISPTYTQAEAAVGPYDASLDKFLDLPKTFPANVAAKARSITKGDVTPYEKALSLQEYFNDNFSYSLSVPAGDGNSAIETFLKDRKGFCQQFAGTMAAMARALGIPAVVVVGFTPGQAQSDGSYVVTTHDAHAWPMLYFTGLGWLRFEPTVGIQNSGRGNLPVWTRGVTPEQVRSSATATTSLPSTTANPSASASQCTAQIRRISGGCEDAGNTGALAATRPFASLGPLGVFPRWFEHWFLTGSAAQIGGKLTVLVLLLLAAVPALGRLGRRRKRRVLVKQAERYLAKAARGEVPESVTADGPRWQRDGAALSPMATIALAAWAELRECADDLGYAWVESDTPRQAASRLTSAARMDAEATEAIGRVTTLTEQARYAESAGYDQQRLRALPSDLRTLRSALAEHATRVNRIKAAILPASSLSRLREGRERFSASIYRGGRPRE
ncbi:MAG: transglutaminaseTgpA domain-containing protein [Actinocrinis sp.]